jgi:hypothetical protein
MRAYLFPLLFVKTQSYLGFTNVYDRICFLVVHFYEDTRQLSAHTRASCGGDECDADSLSLRIQSYIQTYILCVRVYTYIYVVCFFF